MTMVVTTLHPQALQAAYIGDGFKALAVLAMSNYAGGQMRMIRK
ncbi:hypothetical protein [Acidisphaera sp. S103]|nr:hypothetical protein [Acidisphaera sp. S103]